MSEKENIGTIPYEFFEEDLIEEFENQPSSYKRTSSLTELPDSKEALDTAHLPIRHLSRRRTSLTLSDITTPSPDTPNTARCNEIIDDIKEHLVSKMWGVSEYLTDDYLSSFNKLSEEDLEQRLKLIEIPIPPKLLGGLKDLNLSEWDLIRENVPKPLYSAIIAYMENPEAYKKDRQIDITYNSQIDMKNREIDMAYNLREKERGK